MLEKDAESLFAVDESQVQEPEVETPEETGFAPEEPAPTPEPDPAPEPAATPTEQQQPGFVPPTAVLDERDKRQKLERELAEIRAQVARTQQEQAGEAPSIYDDPIAYQEQLEARVAATEFRVREEMSDRFAKQTHGEEAVSAAESWGMEQAKTDRYFAQRYMSQPDPKGWLIAEHKRDQIAKDPAAFARQWAEQNGYAPLNTQPQAATPAPVQSAAPAAVPPRSIASAPSSSGAVHTPITSAMEAVSFKLG